MKSGNNKIIKLALILTIKFFKKIFLKLYFLNIFLNIYPEIILVKIIIIANKTPLPPKCILSPIVISDAMIAVSILK